MKLRFTYIKVILFFTSLVILAGCSTWGNFTTYFNRYYNTKKLFEQAESQILAQKTDLFDTKDILVPGNVNQLLANVITDASKILQFNSETKYVDDALLILGKSFYYQGNYQKALRKFEELIGIQKESDLILESRLWIAKTQLKLKLDEQSLTSFDAVIKDAIKEEETGIYQDAFVEVISYHILQKDYSTAIKSINELLKVSEDDDINARVLYELGKLYYSNNDFIKAEDAFIKAIDISSDYNIIYHSKIELAKSYRSGNKVSDALLLLDEMNLENKNAENFPEIELEKGITYLEQNKVNEAKDILAKVDTTYPISKSSAIAKYKLGEIYEYNLRNFESAKNYYQKANYSVLPIEYKIESNNKVTLFNNYFKLVDGIKLFKRQIDYLNYPDEFLKDSLTYYRQKEIERERLLSANNLVNNNATNITNNNIATNPQQETTETNKNNTIIDPNLNNVNNINKVKDIIPPIRPTVDADSLGSLILNYQFELATLFVTEFNLQDSVYKYFNYILTSFPNSRFETQSLFALGNYYLTVGDTLKADSLFLEIYTNHKNERIVNFAALALGKPLFDFDYDPAKELYSNAEDKIEKGDFTNAINELINIYKSHPKSDYAPKALYAVGWTLENSLSNPDSAAAVYSIITKEYPTSIYGTELVDKVKIYNEEVKRLNILKEVELKAKLNKDKKNLNDQKNINKPAIKDSSIVSKISDLDLSIDNSRRILIDSLKKMGINLPDSIIQNILLKRKQNQTIPKDSLKNKRQILIE
ncbi:MAG: hypothetical protein CO128_02745 [Ignavibacteriales bacterium CG_4_9_14_3_um_filter_30_11]|nr:MAG: hypothetical protein CO128_02745 [Ignavibacteriales bacterium CG_4_9_14_3_um_filter_30_11]